MFHNWNFLIEQAFGQKFANDSMKQIPPTRIQFVELFVDEVFSEFLSELFLIFPPFDVCMLLPSFQPTMIGNNHRETVVAMC